MFMHLTWGYQCSRGKSFYDEKDFVCLKPMDECQY